MFLTYLIRHPNTHITPNLVSFFGEKWIQLIIREISVSFINFPLPAICLHLFWCHGHVPWCGRLHLHSSRPCRGYSAGTNHRSCTTHLTGRCLIPSGSSLTPRSGCGSWCFCTSTVCPWSLSPAWSGMPWGLTYKNKKDKNDCYYYYMINFVLQSRTLFFWSL